MTWILVIGIIVLLASLSQGPSDLASRTKDLDPGSDDDFGGKLK